MHRLETCRRAAGCGVQVSALKLLYGLDGLRRGPLPQGVPPPPNWQAWAAAAFARIADPCEYPLSVEQVRKRGLSSHHPVHTRSWMPGQHASIRPGHAASAVHQPCRCRLFGLDRNHIASVQLVEVWMRGLRLQTLALPRTARRRYAAHLRHAVFGQAPVPPDFQELLASLDVQSRSPAAPPQQPRRQRWQQQEASYTTPAAYQPPTLPADAEADDAGRPPASGDTSEDPGGDVPVYTSSMHVNGEPAGHPDYLAVLTVGAGRPFVS